MLRVFFYIMIRRNHKYFEIKAAILNILIHLPTYCKH